MQLRDIAHAVRRADIASLPIKEACRALADLPAAKKYDVSPALLWRAAHNALPPEQADKLLEQADKLLEQAGIRGRFRLADLAYIAQYDPVLCQMVAAIIWLMEEHR